MENLKKIFKTLFILVTLLAVINCESGDDDGDDKNPKITYGVKFTANGTTYNFTKGATATEDAKCFYNSNNQEVRIIASLNGLTDGDISNDTSPFSIYFYMNSNEDLSTISGSFQFTDACMYYTLDNAANHHNVDAGGNFTITENTDDYIKGTFYCTSSDNGNVTITNGSFTLKTSQ